MMEGVKELQSAVEEAKALFGWRESVGIGRVKTKELRFEKCIIYRYGLAIAFAYL